MQLNVAPSQIRVGSLSSGFSFKCPPHSHEVRLQYTVEAIFLDFDFLAVSEVDGNGMSDQSVVRFVFFANSIFRTELEKAPRQSKSLE